MFLRSRVLKYNIYSYKSNTWEKNLVNHLPQLLNKWKLYFLLHH